MKNIEIENKLREIVTNNPVNYGEILLSKRHNYKYIIDYIEENTPLLKDPIYNLTTKIYWILNGLTDFPKCKHPNCSNKIGIGKRASLKNGYRMQYCSRSCLFSDPEGVKKRQQAYYEKTGYKNPMHNPAIIKKMEENCMKKYGAKNMFSSKHFRKKSKETCLEKYGVDSFSKTKEYRNKVKETSLKNWGKTSPMKSEKVKEILKEKTKEKWGYEYASQSPIFQEKRRKHLKEQYGDNYNQVIYGGKGNPGQSRRAYNDFILNSKIVEPLFSEEEYVKTRQKNINNFKFRCKKCGTIFESWWDNGGTKSCPNCSILGGTSIEERELFDYLKECAIEFKQNDRILISPLEIDAYIPSKHLAIELDGLYWHSTLIQKDKNYHLHKTEECEKQGIQLIHIFEDEWLYKQDIVKSRLKNLLGIYNNKCFARQCEVKEVSSSDSAAFQFQNHIQGAVNSKVNLGLYFKDELVSLMTFSKPRFDKKHEWELVRFCNKLGWHIPGAASKLLTHFEREYKPKNIVSYADRRWSKGNLYRQLGFELDHISPPDYSYWKNEIHYHRYSRVKYQKHKLSKLLENFDPNKTEVENMQDNNFWQVFDSGNLVFIKKYA